MTSSADETAELYRELIADHAKNPRNFREMTDADRRADGHNRSCGDKFTVWIRVADGVIADVSFKGSGCSIGTSSASMMTEAIKGKTIDEARALFDQFHGMLTGDAEVQPDVDSLSKLAAFAGVKRFPIRVKCATLAWHTLMAGMDNSAGTVTTERADSLAGKPQAAAV